MLHHQMTRFCSNYGHDDPRLAFGAVLDVGCGVPRFREVMQGLPWLFVDLFPKDSGIIRANVLDMPFMSGTFSQVVACRVVSNVLGAQLAAIHELTRVLRRGGRLYLFDSYKPALDQINAERAEAGMPPLPKAATGSVPLSEEMITHPLAFGFSVRRYPVAPEYYAWTRYQFPFLNEGRFPETPEERMPPLRFEANDRICVQSLWVYEKV